MFCFLFQLKKDPTDSSRYQTQPKLSSSPSLFNYRVLLSIFALCATTYGGLEIYRLNNPNLEESSRSQLSHLINQRFHIKNIIIPKELDIEEQTLPSNTQFISLREKTDCFIYYSDTFIALPTQVSSYNNESVQVSEWQDNITFFSNMISRAKHKHIIHEIDGEQPFYLDKFTENPAMTLLKAEVAPACPLKNQSIPLNNLKLPKHASTNPQGETYVLANGSIQLPYVYPNV